MGSLPERPVLRPTPTERLRDWVVWFGVGRLLSVAVSVVAIVAGGAWLLRAPAPPVEASLPFTPAASSTPVNGSGAPASTPSEPLPTSTVPSGPLVVHVAGAVAVPGVHTVPSGARVADAVTAAGGATAEAHTDAINLAAPLSDGDRVYVPTRGEVEQVPVGVTGSGGGDASEDAVPAGPIDVNVAGVEELDVLPGVGPATAAAIVAHREEHGPFRSVDALGEVRGIGPTKLASLRGLVTV